MLATREGDVAVGAMICFDREVPESARVLALGGAELVLVPNSCTLDEGTRGFGDVRLAQLRARAFENGVAIAMTNYAAPHDDGHSCAFHPDGGEIVMAGAEEELVLADVDLTRLRRFRMQEVGRVRARRPERYGAITRRPRG